MFVQLAELLQSDGNDGTNGWFSFSCNGLYQLCGPVYQTAVGPVYMNVAILLSPKPFAVRIARYQTVSSQFSARHVVYSNCKRCYLQSISTPLQKLYQ